MDLERALKEGLIVRIEKDKNLVQKEINESKKDLEKAEENLEERDYKWCIITSYYSMFHMAKALMFSRGLREKGHFAVVIFLGYLIKKGKLEEKYKNYYRAAKNSREAADYRYTYSRERAEEILKYSKKFDSRLEKLIE